MRPKSTSEAPRTHCWKSINITKAQSQKRDQITNNTNKKHTHNTLISKKLKHNCVLRNTSFLASLRRPGARRTSARSASSWASPPRAMSWGKWRRSSAVPMERSARWFGVPHGLGCVLLFRRYSRKGGWEEESKKIKDVVCSRSFWWFSRFHCVFQGSLMLVGAFIPTFYNLQALKREKTFLSGILWGSFLLADLLTFSLPILRRLETWCVRESFCLCLKGHLLASAWPLLSAWRLFGRKMSVNKCLQGGEAVSQLVNVSENRTHFFFVRHKTILLTAIAWTWRSWT